MQSPGSKMRGILSAGTGQAVKNEGRIRMATKKAQRKQTAFAKTNTSANAAVSVKPAQWRRIQNLAAQLQQAVNQIAGAPESAVTKKPAARTAGV